MNKAIFSLLLLFVVSVPVFAQTKPFIGKWTPVKIELPDLGVIPVEEDSLRNFAYQKTIEDNKGVPLTAQDSADVEELVQQLHTQFGTMSMEFRADKTYSAELEGQAVSGKYSYNAATKMLTTIAKGKPARTSKVTFVNGMMRLVNTKEKITLYMKRV